MRKQLAQNAGLTDKYSLVAKKVNRTLFLANRLHARERIYSGFGIKKSNFYSACLVGQISVEIHNDIIIGCRNF